MSKEEYRRLLREHRTKLTREELITELEVAGFTVRQDLREVGVVTKSQANNKLDEVRQVAHQVRELMVAKYGDRLNGHCIEASDEIYLRLDQLGIEAHVVEGWCIYDRVGYGSERDYDEHTWVEAVIDGDWVYVDVTADQFNAAMDIPFPTEIAGAKPECMVDDEPTYLSEDE